jgi:hypothetical protein
LTCGLQACFLFFEKLRKDKRKGEKKRKEKRKEKNRAKTGFLSA